MQYAGNISIAFTVGPRTIALVASQYLNLIFYWMNMLVNSSAARPQHARSPRE
jgi:hypothetical protein